MSQEIMTVDSSLPALRKPEEIVEEAKARANVLMQIVKEKGLSKTMGNKEHIQVEAWQTVGRFFNCTAGADEADPVEVDGVKGAKAHARVIDERTGAVVSEAISYCMRDEPNWRNKPWFQVASMAQTRAISKALANKFRWVAVLAGYSGTPAEEMTEDGAAGNGAERSRHDHPMSKPTTQHAQAAPSSPFIWRVGADHKGKPVTDIPDKYLEWAKTNMKLQDHADAARMELDRRTAQASFAEEGE